MGFLKTAGIRLYHAGRALLGRSYDPEGWYSYGSSSFETAMGNITYDDLVTWGWFNGWGFACINLISNAVASLPWQVVGRNGEAQEDHPLLSLFGQPAKSTGALPKLGEALAYLLIGGETYILQGSPESGPNIRKPTKLWVFPPNEITVTPNTKSYGDILNFKRGANTYTTDEMCQIKLFNPRNPLSGTSPIEADYPAFKANTQIMWWYSQTLEQGGRPGGQLVTQSPVGVSSQAGAAAIKFAETRISGISNAGRVVLPPPGFKVEDLALRPLELGITPMEEATRLRIFSVFRVPPECAGDHKHATYSNYMEAGQRFYQDTVLDYAQRFAAKMNEWLAPRFGDGQLAVDTQNIPALQEDKDALAERFTKYVKSSIKTPNEARESLGLDKVGPEGDELLADSRMIPLKQITGEPLIGTIAPKEGTE